MKNIMKGCCFAAVVLGLACSESSRDEMPSDGGEKVEDNTISATDGDTDSDVDGDTDSDADGDTDSDADNDTDSDSDSDTDSDVDSDTDSDADGDVDSDSDSDTDSDVDSDTDSDADTCEYTCQNHCLSLGGSVMTGTCPDGQKCCNIPATGDGDTDSDIDGDSDTDTDGDTDTDTDSDDTEIGVDTNGKTEIDTEVVTSNCSFSGDVGLDVGDLVEDATLYECDGTPVQVHDILCRNDYTMLMTFALW